MGLIWELEPEPKKKKKQTSLSRNLKSLLSQRKKWNQKSYCSLFTEGLDMEIYWNPLGSVYIWVWQLGGQITKSKIMPIVIRLLTVNPSPVMEERILNNRKLEIELRKAMNLLKNSFPHTIHTPIYQHQLF